MALVKQAVTINFQAGLDLKTDPYQLSPGQFLSLNNSVFTTTGRLTKRYGFEEVTSLPNANQSTLTTLNDNLIATGSSLYAFSADTDMWLNQGIVQPVQLTTLPLIRVSTSQTSPDTATAANGLICLAYMDNGQAYYQVSDSVTGQQIVKRQTLPATAVFPRVFLLGNYFILTFLDTVSAATHLQYIAISTLNPANVSSPADIASNVNSLTTGYDGVVVTTNNQLYLAWGTSTAVQIAFMTRSLAVSAAVTIASSATTLMSVMNDTVASRVFLAFWDASSTNAFSAAFDYTLTPRMAKTQILTGVIINELTAVASTGIQTVFYTTTNSYAYDAAIRTDFTSTVTCTLPASGTGTGTVGSPTVILRSVGLASKAFISSNGTTYVFVAYGDTNLTPSSDDSNQPTYFLIDSLGNIYMKLAYANGGGYAQTQVLPSINASGDNYIYAYLNNDFLATVNKGTNLPAGTQINGIYTQTGVNIATFSLNTTQQHSNEIAGTLNLTGGILWEYDGVRPVENNFNVWPENVEVSGSPTVGSLVAGTTYFWQFCYEWTNNQGNLERSAPSIPVSYTPAASPATSFTGTTASGFTTIDFVSSVVGLQVGQIITSSGIVSAGTYITAINASTSTITISPAAIGGGNVSHTFTVTPVTSAVINVPTDRLTYKIAPNPIRIVGYRWSSTQQVYYQFTSLTSPTLNDTTIDYVSFTDSAADSTILGNNIIYTTGGVVEDIGAPSSIDSALFDNRLWLIDAEDQNLLWFSKQVIENVPVEMSDLLTFYVAPTTSAQGSTGTLAAIYPMDDKLCLFKKDAIYYINGTGPDNTGSNSQYSQPIFITAAVGCNNPNSIVLTPNGLMFQSDKGIWLLGRDLQTQYIGDRVEGFNTQTVMSATAIPATTQVRFILDNSATLMYDYYFNQWATHSNIEAISSTLYESTHTYLNSIGQVFQEASGTYLDGSTPVLLSLTTSWINVAGLQGYERFYFANLLGTYQSPFTLNCTLAYDYNSSAQQAIPVLPDNYVTNYGGEASWGSGGSWGGPGDVFTARLFPNKQKCQSFQLSIQEIFNPAFGQSAGQGLTLSGVSLTVGVKRGWRTQSAAKSFGS